MGGGPITGREQAAYRLELARGTDYGDEVECRTPWELFDEADAGQALAVAEEAVSLADQIVLGSGHEQ